MVTSTRLPDRRWDPGAFLSPPPAGAAELAAAADSSSSTRQAMIILNLPINRLDIFLRIWSQTSLRYCADGGANRLYDALATDDRRRSYLPDLVKGDLDSLRADVREFYEAEGVKVDHDPDQYSTDLMKCVAALGEVEQARSLQFDLILIGGLTGRLDQTVHTLSYIHKLRTTRARVWVVSDDEVAWCLDTGMHEIAIDHAILGPTCGILPLGLASARITTTGLEWDVEDWETSFDTQISTSNHVVPGKDVTVETSGPVWWCCAITPTDGNDGDHAGGS